MLILLAAALSGFAVLTLEILGVHWLAPWFGTSALVWSNQIGVVLLAMALGGWYGGRVAKNSAEPQRTAGAALLVSGLLVALSIPALPVLAGWLLPEGLSLDEAARLFLGGSLGSAILLFAPPVFLMSMVAPLLVEARVQQRADESAGQAAGEIGAAGTIGSLLGVFGSSLVAIPWLGTRPTLVATAVLLLATGAFLMRLRLKSAGAAVVVVSALSLSASLGADPAREAHLPDGAEVRAVRETSIQHLRVIEWPDGARWLQMNEGLDSYQSIWFSDHRSFPGGYYDLFALAPLYAEVSQRGAPAEVWILGLAAGSAMRPLDAGMGEVPWQAVGVEIDAGLIELCAEWMPLLDADEARLTRVAGGDARACLRAAPRDLDVILLDAYANQFEIPLHLATEEFFAEAHGHLRDGGVLAINLGTSEEPGSRVGFVDAVRAAVATSFGEHVRVHQVARSRNHVLFARKAQALPTIDVLADQLPGDAPPSLGGALLPGQTLEGRPVEAPFRLTDDRNPLALEQARVWWGGRQ